jgi:hypothetical protein
MGKKQPTYNWHHPVRKKLFSTRYVYTYIYIYVDMITLYDYIHIMNQHISMTYAKVCM